MSNEMYPYIEGITLSDIVEKIMQTFGVLKKDIAEKIFQNYTEGTAVKYLGQAEENINRRFRSDNEYQNLFDLIKDQAGGTSFSFKTTIQNWYPSLQAYAREEEIMSILKVNLQGAASTGIPVRNVSKETVGSKFFINFFLDDIDNIDCVKMAFHSGWNWLREDERSDLLKVLGDKSIRVQVMVNPESVIRKIASSMEDPRRKLDYRGFNESIETWHNYSKEYKSIDVRITDSPIMRQITIIELKNGLSFVLLRDYVYNSPANDNLPHKRFSNSTSYFDFYCREFNYLWENGSTYDEWHSSLEYEIEARSATIDTGKYVLLLPNHQDPSARNSEWIRASLDLFKDHTAKLYDIQGFSIQGFNGFEDTEYEIFNFFYRGFYVVNQNYLTISLFSKTLSESMTITFFRSSHSVRLQRYAGILSGYSPTGGFLHTFAPPGQPISFKCACFKEPVSSKINLSFLMERLKISSEESKEGFITITEQDRQLFYDKKLFQS